MMTIDYDMGFSEWEDRQRRPFTDAERRIAREAWVAAVGRVDPGLADDVMVLHESLRERHGEEYPLLLDVRDVLRGNR
jgi:hypothetical protein